MARHNNPRIATDGLALYYDMGNTQKSWKGAPTTNLVPNPLAGWNGSSFVLSYNSDATNTHTYSYVTGVPNPINSPGVLRYTTGTTGYKYWAIRSLITTTGTHTFSYYARIVSGPTTSSNLGNSQLWRSNNVDQSVTGNWNPTYTTEWVRYSTTGPCTAGTNLDYFPIHSGSIIGGYTIEYCGFQLESGTYATPFVAGSRSDTQAILDLINQNTLTATSLTYASDNTFSFNGTSNYINCGNSSAYNFGDGNFTVGAWFYRDANATTNLRLLSKGAGGNAAGEAGFAFFGGDTSISFAVNPSGTRTFAATSITTGTPTYITGVVERGGLQSIYKNGVFANSVSAPTGSFTGAADLCIGCNSTSAGGRSVFWDGGVYNVHLYNRALTAAEVAQNFNALRGRYGI